MNRGRGFTLLEVMMALFIFALIAASLTEVFAGNVVTSGKLKEKTLATWIAENEMAEFHASGVLPDHSPLEKRVDFAGAAWRVVIVTSDARIPGVNGIKRVDIKVAWGDAPKDDYYPGIISSYVIQ